MFVELVYDKRNIQLIVFGDQLLNIDPHNQLCISECACYLSHVNQGEGYD